MRSTYSITVFDVSLGPTPERYRRHRRSPRTNSSTPAVTRSQAELFEAIQPHCEDLNPYYRPAGWVPHITLAHDDLTPDKLEAVLTDFSARDFSWAMGFEALTLIEDMGPGKAHRERFTVTLTA